MSIVGKKGVDISAANGDVDISRIKSAGYEFVMIRCGFGSDMTSQDDSQFENNVKKCEAAGLPWGVYLYSYALNVDEAKSEAQHVLRLLKNKKPTLPVAFDMEDADGYKAKHGMPSKSTLVNICKTFLKTVSDAGYYVSLYAGLSWLDNQLNDKSLLDTYDIWVAQWYSKCQYTGKYGMWQYGGETNYLESNSIPGVGTIDKNYAYIDYPTVIKQKGLNGWTKSDSTKPSSSTSTITEAQLRQKVADTINNWVGAVEGDSTHTEILKIYNAQNPLPVGYKMQPHDAWCAATVSAAWLKVGIAEYTGTECGCGRFRDDAKKRGIWVENDAYKPKIGDAVIYYWSDNGVGDCQTGADHIGIVTGVGDTTFIVTEGNMGNGVVGKRTMNINGRYIRGFIAPDYADIAKKVSGKIVIDNTPVKKPIISIPNAIYKVKAGGKWYPEVKNLEDYAGVVGKAITDVAIKFSEGTCKYRVRVNGRWLPYVTGYNVNDYNNGYAGNGKAIEAIEVYYNTPTRIAKGLGYFKAKYRVSPVNRGYYDWQYDNEKTNGQDGYAGTSGIKIDRFQLVLSK